MLTCSVVVATMGVKKTRMKMGYTRRCVQRTLCKHVPLSIFVKFS